MSHIRIIKGKLTETVKGEYNMHAKENITFNSAKQVTDTGVAKGVSYGNPKDPPKPEIKAKIMVEFRPHNNWTGEFGFDWVRVNDSKLEVDNPYNGIIGKYGVIYGSKPNAKFTADSNKYKSILGEYSFFGVYKGRYFVPNMTLTVGQTATLNAIVHSEEAPDKLHYAYNTDVFDITILKKFTKAKGVNFDENSVSIKCKKAFSSPETIRIIATKNKLMQKVGEIKVLPNNTPVEKKVLIIPVEYRKKSGNIKFTNEITYVNNILRQSLIQAKLSTYKSVFKTGSWFSDWFFTTKDKNGNKFIDMSSFRSLHRYLDDDFMSIKANKIYDSYYRVYCMPDSLGLNGVAEDVGQGVKTVIVFQNRDNFTTMVHELLHSMGVYHTFDNDSKYTFEFRKTDNVMDYTHQIGKKRFTTNIWQWRILNKNI